jgi:hypothetical protein
MNHPKVETPELATLLVGGVYQADKPYPEGDTGEALVTGFKRVVGWQPSKGSFMPEHEVWCSLSCMRMPFQVGDLVVTVHSSRSGVPYGPSGFSDHVRRRVTVTNPWGLMGVIREVPVGVGHTYRVEFLDKNKNYGWFYPEELVPEVLGESNKGSPGMLWDLLSRQG